MIGISFPDTRYYATIHDDHVTIWKGIMDLVHLSGPPNEILTMIGCDPQKYIAELNEARDMEHAL